MRSAIVLLSLFSLFFTQKLYADVIILKNGDRISGTVVKKETNKVIIKNDYAGKISILWSKIASITTKQPVRIMLNDKTFISGPIVSSAGDSLTIKSTQIAQPVEVKLARVKYINPSRKTLGIGTTVHGRVNVGISVSDGNTEASNYNIDTEIVVRSSKNRFTTTASLYRAKDNNIETENKSFLGLKYDHFLSKKNYLYGTTSFTKDKFKDLKLKSTIGFGYGHQLYESKERNLALEGGLNYVNDDYILSTDDDYAAGRWAIKYDQRIFKGNKTTFFHNHEGLFDLNNSDNITLTSQTGLRFPLIAGMSASAQINADWDNSPAPGAKKTDLKYLLNIGYTW